MTTTKTATDELQAIMTPVYECPYCGRVERNMGVMMMHRNECNMNPNLRTCCTCKYGTEFGMASCGQATRRLKCSKIGVTFAGSVLWAVGCKYWEQRESEATE